MKIFIQKSNRSIRLIHRYFFNSTYHHDLFSIFRQKFSFQKNFQKSSLQKSHLIKDRIFKIQLPSFQGSFDLGNFQFQLGREKIRKDWKKVSYALGIQLARFPPPISSPRNGYRARQFAKQPRRSISSTRSMATRDPESSTSGLFEGGSCSKHVPLARSNFLSNARPTSPPRGERSQEGWDEAAITRFVIHARLSKNVFA